MTGLVLRKFVPFFYSLDDTTRFNFQIDALSAVSFGIFAGAFFPFFSITAVRLGASGMLLALITAAPFMGQLFAVYWGHRSDQGQKLPFVVSSGILSRVTLILLALTHNVELFALLIVLHFLFAAAGSPAYTALMKKIYPLQFRGQLMGKIQFVIGICRVAVTYFAGIWLDMYGYRSVFIIAGIAGIISSLIYSRLDEPKEIINSDKKKFSLKSFVKVFKNDKMLKLAITGFFIFDLGNLILAPVYPLIQVKYMGLTNFEIGHLSIFWILGWFITAPYWGKVVDHYDPIRTVIIAVLLFIGSPLIYLFNSPYYLLMVASFLGGAAGSSLEVGWLNMMINLGGENSSRYSGIYLTFLGIRGVIGPIIGNLLVAVVNPFSIFLISIQILLLGLIPFIILIEKQKKAASKSDEMVTKSISA